MKSNIPVSAPFLASARGKTHCSCRAERHCHQPGRWCGRHSSRTLQNVSCARGGALFGAMLTASANNNNLRRHVDGYKCREGKGCESLADANAGRKVRRSRPLYERVAVPSTIRCRGYVEKVWECTSVSASGSPQCKRGRRPVKSELFVAGVRQADCCTLLPVMRSWGSGWQSSFQRM